MQNSRRTMGALNGKITRLRHQFKLYQTMERVRSAQAEVEQYQVALAREEEKQQHIWMQIHSLGYRLSRHYLIPLISTILYAGARLSWLNRILAPVVRRSLTRLTVWASPPATVYSQDGLSRLMENLRKTEVLLHMLTEVTSPRLRNSSPRHEEAHLPDMHEGGEQTADSCPMFCFNAEA